MPVQYHARYRNRLRNRCGGVVSFLQHRLTNI
jgi:hypothetical protein